MPPKAITTETFKDLPIFHNLNMDEVNSRLDNLLAINREKIVSLCALEQVSWENFVSPLEVINDSLDKFWSPIRHLNSVKNNEEIREAYNKGIVKISEYSTELGQNKQLYQHYIALTKGVEYKEYSQAQRKCLENNILDFELSGVSLTTEKKIRFKEIKLQLSKLKTNFEENVLDSSNAWFKQIEDESLLVGIPENDIEAARIRAERKELTGWVFNLDFPSYNAVVTHADDRQLRRDMYEAFVTRASDIGPHDLNYDNSENINNILRLRAELAALLGFDNFAELSLVKKMAKTPHHVISFLQDLVSKSKPPAESELKELQDFSKQVDSNFELQAWDITYFSNKLKEEKYAISEEDLKSYFPADKVIEGLFKVVKNIFGINVSLVSDVDVWHPDVCFYQIEDAEGKLRGGFYLDTYARDKKRGGAWMDECISRMYSSEGLQLPVAYLTCNLTPPVGDQVALFTHNEVTTLFHEFGHGLHHMLTQINVRDVSGISGVEWDAVELPSQFLENWCWQREALDLISGHYVTGEKIPEELLTKAYRAKNFQSALLMLRQLEFALFDMRIHIESTLEHRVDVQKILDEVRSQIALLPLANFNRFQNGFSHIFAGGYSAGYFSYKWAEVLSADAFSLFEEEGIFNTEIGQEFLQNILEKGGSEKALELFKKFRGREPEIDALLRQCGLAA